MAPPRAWHRSIGGVVDVTTRVHGHLIDGSLVPCPSSRERGRCDERARAGTCCDRRPASPGDATTASAARAVRSARDAGSVFAARAVVPILAIGLASGLARPELSHASPSSAEGFGLSLEGKGPVDGDFRRRRLLPAACAEPCAYYNHRMPALTSDWVIVYDELPDSARSVGLSTRLVARHGDDVAFGVRLVGRQGRRAWRVIYETTVPAVIGEAGVMVVDLPGGAQVSLSWSDLAVRSARDVPASSP